MVEKQQNQSSYKERETFFKSPLKEFIPQEGQNTLRIAPALFDFDAYGDSFGIELYVHFQVGANEARVLCNQSTYGEACPVCEEAAKARADGDAEYAKSLRPSKRYLCYVKLVEKGHMSEDILIWNMPGSVDRSINGVAKTLSGKLIYFDDDEEGCVLGFTRTGKNLNTKYDAYQMDPTPMPLSAVDVEWLKNNPIDEFLINRTYEEVAKLFHGRSATSTAVATEIATAEVESNVGIYDAEDIASFSPDEVEEILVDEFGLNIEGLTPEEQLELLHEECGVPVPEKEATADEAKVAKLRKRKRA